MARPKKNNAEYFSHDADMRNDVRVKALRRQFSHEGYAVWCYLLETLTDADHFVVAWDELHVELLAADYDVSAQELQAIVAYCVKIGLLQLEQERLFSAAHRRRFAALLGNRERKRLDGAAISADTLGEGDNDAVPVRRNPAGTAAATGNGLPKSLSKVKVKVEQSSVERAHTGKFGRRGGVGEEEQAADFLCWVAARFPAVQAMREPFTPEQAAEILARFGDEEINRLLEAIDNKEATKYRSARATFDAFAANDRRLCERNAVRFYTYHEMCNVVSSGCGEMSDFELRYVEGVKCWVRKIEALNAKSTAISDP